MHSITNAKNQVTQPDSDRPREGKNGKAPAEGTPGYWLKKIIVESEHHTSIRNTERSLGVLTICGVFQGTRGIASERVPELCEKLSTQFPDTWARYGNNLKECVAQHGGFKIISYTPRVKQKVNKEAQPRIHAGDFIKKLTEGDFSLLTEDMGDSALKDMATWKKIVTGDLSIPARVYIEALYKVREEHKLHMTDISQYRAVRQLVSDLAVLARSEHTEKPVLVRHPKVPSIVNVFSSFAMRMGSGL